MSEEGFLSRWSQRKRATLRGEAPPEPVAETPPVAPEPAAEAPAAPPEDPPFDLASLPPLETLTAESDFLPFLARNVPDLVKRAALRKMWSLDIGIRDYVGPADYAWDYNAVDGVPGSSLDLVGDVRRLLAQAIGTPPEPEEAPPAVADSAPPDPASEAADIADPPSPLRLSAAAPEPPPPPTEAAAPDPEPRPRRHGAASPS